MKQRHWGVCEVISRKEPKALVWLTGQGHRCWLPLCRSREDHPATALFRGYLFVDTGTGLPLPGRDTNHAILGMLRFGDSLALVPDRVVEELIERARSDGGVIILNPVDKFEKGQKISIQARGFENRQGIFDRGDEYRAVVFLDILSRSVRTIVPISAVRAV